MGRRVTYTRSFDRWRESLRESLSERFDPDFADEAIRFVDEDVAAHGESESDWGFLEVIAPAQVLAARRRQAEDPSNRPLETP